MTDKMLITLSHEAAADVWGANALLSFGEQGAVIHATGKDEDHSGSTGGP